MTGDLAGMVPLGRDGVRVAIVGVGARSEIALHVPDAWPGAHIVAAVDPSAPARRRASILFGDIPVFESVSSLVASLRVDAAIVTTPDDTHAAIAIELLMAGVAVYLEKPLATTLADADRILTVSAETGVPLYVGHNFRHASVVQIMKTLIDQGAVGDVKTIWVRHFVGNGGDYYFKDWHADRARTNTLLLQKASHDIDVIHYLAGAYTQRVSAMGALMVYGEVTNRRSRDGELMPSWFSFDNWPPTAAEGLNPTIDVEDVSMMHMALDNGVLASYEQCHFTPDYWRNYTVIGTAGRMENIGDTAGGVVKVWNRRRNWSVEADLEQVIGGADEGHEDADIATMREFFRLVVDGSATIVSPLAARAAVAAGALAAESLRGESSAIDVPPLPPHVVDHFRRMIPNPRAPS